MSVIDRQVDGVLLQLPPAKAIERALPWRVARTRAIALTAVIDAAIGSSIEHRALLFTFTGGDPAIRRLRRVLFIARIDRIDA